MECCYTEDCGEYAVTPVLMAPCPRTKGEEPPMCFPCLPRCPKGEIVYCCDKRPGTQRTKSWTKNYDDYRDESYGGDYDHYESGPQRSRQRPSPSGPNRHERPSGGPPQTCCPTCCRPTACQPACKPVKTKYVIPCYRYEDGRIERYVPTRYGRLPMSAYRRNGTQDQIHGYRGAIRYLCANEGPNGCYVHTAVEPLKRIFPRVTQEVLPVSPIPSSALRRDGLQDQKFVESGGISYIRKCWHDARWSDYPIKIPVKPMKKLAATLSKKR